MGKLTTQHGKESSGTGTAILCMKNKSSPTNFYHVNGSGGIGARGASAVIGVRLAFLIATYREETENCHS